MNPGRCAAALVTSVVLASSSAWALPIARIPGAPPVVPFGPIEKLKYYGGRVISNVEVVAVFWGPSVNTTIQMQIGAFYTAVVKSSYVDWLTEYDTIGKTGLVDMLPGSAQHIGRGKYAGAKTIMPANQGTTLTDAEVAAELVAQIQGGHLPPPSFDAGGNVNTLYMIDFPPGVTITLLGMQSCQTFGAYHFTVRMNGKSVPYGVHPDCGYSFDLSTLVHSHELIEAMTDTEVGLADQMAPTARPIAWATLDNSALSSQEIGDICEGNGSGAAFAGFTVQKVWSNFAGACVIGVPICDGVVPMPCRPCNTFDSGNACDGATPACATAGAKTGRCVTCTAAYANACTGATPVCDDTKNACVGCVKSSDCKTPASPVCETTSQTCRACKVDSECAMGSVCDTTSDTHKGECVACNTDAQCPGQKCDSSAHKCVPIPAPDAGIAVNDGGVVNADTPSTDSGCGCAAVGPAETRGGALAAIAALALGLRRRRRG